MPTGDERVPLTALHWGSTLGRGRNPPGVAGCRRAPARGDRADRLEPDRRQGSLLERVAPFSGRRSWGTLAAVMAGSPCPRSSSSVSCSGCCRRCAVTDGSASGRCCCWRQRRVASRPARGVHGTGRRRGYRYRHVVLEVVPEIDPRVRHPPGGGAVPGGELVLQMAGGNDSCRARTRSASRRAVTRRPRTSFGERNRL